MGSNEMTLNGVRQIYDKPKTRYNYCLILQYREMLKDRVSVLGLLIYRYVSVG